MKSSSKYAGCSFWRTQDDWYFFDEERECFALTDKAPDEARRSFEQWLQLVATLDF